MMVRSSSNNSDGRREMVDTYEGPIEFAKGGATDRCNESPPIVSHAVGVFALYGIKTCVGSPLASMSDR